MFLPLLLACATAEPAPEATLRAGQSTVVVHFAEGTPDLGREATLAWVSDAIEATTAWYGRFPTPRADVYLTTARGAGMWYGTAFGGAHPHIKMNIGRATTVAQTRADWKMPHEMIHLGIPEVPRQHHWLEEGIATYAEPWGRVQTGQLTAEKAWLDLVEGLPNGLPQVGDRGLDRTSTWGRTYWGGALYCLLADIEARKRTDNGVGLQDALAHVVAEGGHIGEHWSMDRLLTTADAGTGTTALWDTYQAMDDEPHPVDLGALWAQLGVVPEAGTVRFVDDAPLAHIRRGITEGPARSPSAVR